MAGSRLALVADDAGNDLAEEGRIGIAILVAVDLPLPADRISNPEHSGSVAPASSI
jgi:hypothetical protein